MNSTGTLSEQTGTKYANAKKIRGFSGTENVPVTGTKSVPAKPRNHYQKWTFVSDLFRFCSGLNWL